MAKTKTKPTLTVIKPGPLSLIQDFGRFGVAHLGLTQGGPVDDYSYSWANHLLGNPVNQAALEVTLGQCALRIDFDCEMALCGVIYKRSSMVSHRLTGALFKLLRASSLIWFA